MPVCSSARLQELVIQHLVPRARPITFATHPPLYLTRPTNKEHGEQQQQQQLLHLLRNPTVSATLLG